MISNPAHTRSVGALAIFGGTPAFADTLHVGRPHVGDTERILARMRKVLDSRWLTNDGPYVRELELRIAERLGVAHCLATCSGSMALQLVLRARAMHGEVIVPAFTFVATVHALHWLGLVPVFADIDAHTHQIDPHAVAELVTPRTSGILGVHLWGSPCDVDALSAIAGPRRIGLLLDAAHAFGSFYRHDNAPPARRTPPMIGGGGDVEVFSFHATKFFHTVEGGAVTTNDEVTAERIRRLRDHGFAGTDTVVGVGLNGRMNELSAAVGLILLDDVDALIDINTRHHARYREGLSDIPGVRILPHDEGSNHQYVVMEIHADAAGIERDTLMRMLHAENVRARRYFYPGVHRMEPYASDPRHAAISLPHTDAVCARVLCLPTGASLSTDDVDCVCELIRFSVAHGREIQRRFTASNAGS